MSHSEIVDRLLQSEEPSIRWKVRVHALGELETSKPIRELQSEIRGSPRLRTLLSGVDGLHVYSKWQGAHWVLAALADLGYPLGAAELAPLRERVIDCWLHQQYFSEFEVDTKLYSYRKEGVPLIQGRYRRCGSQQGNALLYLIRLGLDDPRIPKLAERLMHWQWPDGGWNCDRNPEADTSSFMETLLPMCGLFAYGQAAGDRAAVEASHRAAQVFLERRLYKRRSDGTVIRTEFTQLHYPLYWHYDILGGLKAMAQIGLLGDPRCTDALDLLDSKRLPDGGWPAERKHYRAMEGTGPLVDRADWGGTSQKRMNPWVTADALQVLKAAGRLEA